MPFDPGALRKDEQIPEKSLRWLPAFIRRIVSGSFVTGVASFNSRIGAVLPQSGDYNASQVGAVATNVAITPATKTKITYDAKGLVTSGADATTADIADSSGKRYVTDGGQTQANVIGALTIADNDFIQRKSGVLTNRTPTQVTADLDAMVGDSGSGGTKGLVPAPAAGDKNKYLSGGGAYLAPEWILVESYTYTGSAITSFDFAATLDGDNDVAYKIVWQVVSAVSANNLISLRVNGATWAVVRESINPNAGSVGPARDTVTSFASVGNTTSDEGAGVLEFIHTKTGNFRIVMSRAPSNTTAAWNYRDAMFKITTPSQATNITSLGLVTDQASGIIVLRADLYKSGLAA